MLVTAGLMRCNACSSTFQGNLVYLMKHRKNHFIPNFELRSVVLLSALVLGAGTSAYAQSTAAPMAGSAQGGAATSAASGGTASASAKDLDAAFAKADANKDGKLDKTEAQMMPAVAERFDQLDTNGDGFISREEFSKAAGS